MRVPAAPVQPQVSGRNLFIFVGLLAVALTPIAAVAFRPAADLMDFPLSEDAFYSLAVARNLALGNGLTIDGVHWTNGFQPLFTFVCSVFYLIAPRGDLVTPLRLLTVVEAGVFVSSAVLFGSILSRALPLHDDVKRFVRIVGTICFLLSDFLFVQAFNGLETGFLFLMILLTLDRAFRLSGTRAGYMAIGVLLGLCFLTRIDTCFLVAAFCLANLRFGPGTLPQRFVGSLIAGSLAVVIALPWLIYSKLAFGSIMPISGQAYSSLTISGGRLLLAAMQSSNALLPYFRFPLYIWRLDVAFVVLAVTSLLFLGIVTAAAIQLKRDRERRDLEPVVVTTASLLLATTLVLYCGFLTGYYGFISTAMHFYARYLVPYAFLGIAAIATVLGIAASRSLPASLVVGLLLLVQVAHLHVEHSYMMKSEYYQGAVELVRRHVPPGAAVAASQSGTLGYFRDNVVNLDGKVNPDVITYPGFPESLPQYLADNRIDWYVDWAELPLSEKLAADSRWAKVGQIGRTILLHRVN